MADCVARKIVIYGTGNYARILCRMATGAGFEVLAFTSDTEAPEKDIIDGVPFIPSNKIVDFCRDADAGIALGFIGKDQQYSREDKFRCLKREGIRFPNVIQPGVSVDSDDIGHGNVLFAGARIGFQCSIGDCNIFWQNASVAHDNKVGSFNHFGPNSSMAGYAEVSDHCFIGIGSSLNNDAVMERGSLLGANAFLKGRLHAGKVCVPALSQELETSQASLFF